MGSTVRSERWIEHCGAAGTRRKGPHADGRGAESDPGGRPGPGTSVLQPR